MKPRLRQAAAKGEFVSTWLLRVLGERYLNGRPVGKWVPGDCDHSNLT
jgi:hypothetical protein